MKLQKLMFFCHSDFLLAKGTGLIEQQFEAWDFGPVIPYIFQEFKNFTKAPITERAYRFDPITAKRVYADCTLLPEDANLLRSIFNLYKNASASALSQLSHKPNSPWDVARSLFDEGRNPDRRISDRLIHSFQRRASYS